MKFRTFVIERKTMGFRVSDRSGRNESGKEAGMAAKRKSASVKATPPATSVTFSCKIKPDAGEVYLVGDFNNWDLGADRMTKRQGSFRKTKKLKPGEYCYKFLVDGEWHTDPSAEKQVPNEYGTMNSVIQIGGREKR